MQLEAGEVGHPGQRRGIARHDLLGGPARREPQRDHFYPVGSRLRRPLLVEELAVDAVRIADEHVRPPAGGAQRAIGDREVVAHEIELRVASLREKHLARVGDRDFPARNRQQLMFDPARHAPIVT